MTQGVNGSSLLNAAFLQRSPKRMLHTAWANWLCGGNLPTARKDQGGVPVASPIATQQSKRSMRQGHIAILSTFSMADMDKHPGAIDISDLQVDALLQTQTTGVDGAPWPSPPGQAGRPDSVAAAGKSRPGAPLQN